MAYPTRDQDTPAVSLPLKPISSAVSIHLDAVRGAAALLVLLSHLRALFFVDYNELAHHSILLKVIYFATGFGHTAVMVFFVLSGYLVASSAVRAQAQGRWSWTDYLLARLSRLWVVLFPALCLGAAWDLFGLYLWRDSPVYFGMGGYHDMMPVVAQQLSAVIWFGNLCFLQTICVPTLGSNTPLWSLTNEFWYYLLFPLLWTAVMPGKNVCVRIALLTAAVAIAMGIGAGITVGFLIWLMGAALNWLRPMPITRQPWAWMLTTMAFLGTLCVSRFHLLENAILIDLLVGIAFCCVLILILNVKPETLLPAPYVALARWLSRISYTLYLVHVPFLVFMSATLVGSVARWQMDLLHAVGGCIMFVLTLAYAYMIWCLAERHTDRVRKRLRLLLGI